MPEPTNADRAKRAEYLLVFYARNLDRADELAGAELAETLLTDLIADFMHYADAMKMDFENCLRIADMHFTAELAEEGAAS